MIDHFIPDVTAQIFSSQADIVSNSVAKTHALLQDILYFGRTCKILHGQINSEDFCCQLISSLGKELLFLETSLDHPVQSWNNFIANRYQLLGRWLGHSPRLSKFSLACGKTKLIGCSITRESIMLQTSLDGVKLIEVPLTASNLAAWRTQSAAERLNLELYQRMSEEVSELTEDELSVINFELPNNSIIHSEQSESYIALQDDTSVSLYSRNGSLIGSHVVPDTIIASKIINDSTLAIITSANKLYTFDCARFVLMEEIEIPLTKIKKRCVFFDEHALVCFQNKRSHYTTTTDIYYMMWNGEKSFTENISTRFDYILKDKDNFIFVMTQHGGSSCSITRVTLGDETVTMEILDNNIQIFRTGPYAIARKFFYHLGNLFVAFRKRAVENCTEWNQNCLVAYNLESKVLTTLDFSSEECTDQNYLFCLGSKVYSLIAEHFYSSKDIYCRATIFDFG